MECDAVLIIKGEHFPCDWPTEDDGTHNGWAHCSKAAQSLWLGADEAIEAIDRQAPDA